MDEVIATGMAKNPDQRYATTVELARAAHDATTVPLSGPGPTVPVLPSPQPDHHLTAGPIHGQDTQLAATKAAPGLPAAPAPPPEARPTRQRPMWRRPRVLIPALLAIVVLIAAWRLRGR